MKTLLIILLALFSTNLVAQTNIAIDTDGNGLREISDLETLNAIRFRLGGGYELTRNLDFNDDDSYSSPENKITWTTGEGWQPIGDSSNPFTGQFEGNGYTISNLIINRNVGGIGLFGYTGSGAGIANVGLLNVDITVTSTSGGGLVGENRNGTITNSYVTGSVTGTGVTSHMGGLVGWNIFGSITNSYATGSVTGSGSVGGLVGRNDRSTITNSYATGSVTGMSISSIVGGLVGRNSGTITNSYWDINTSGIEASAGGTSKTTVELQLSTAPGSTSNETYYNWSGNDWDFGTSIQYPILKYTDNPNTDSSECHGSDDTTEGLPVCGSLLSPALRYGLSELQLIDSNFSPDFDVIASSYRGTVVSSASTIQFRPITVNPNAKVYITANRQIRDTAIDSGDESSMISLNTDGITIIRVEVESGSKTTQTVIYTLYLNYYEFNGDVDKDDDGLIEIDNLEGLNEMRYQLDGTAYRESEKALKIAVGCPNNRCKGYELTGNLNFNDDDSYLNASLNKSEWTTGEGWQPIGASSSKPFTGHFEGNGFTISNLMIDRFDTNYIGLFGITEAEIANIGLLNVNIIGGSRVDSFDSSGGLVGRNEGTITNSYVSGSVRGSNESRRSSLDLGGLVGLNEGTITNSYVTSSVTGTGINSSIGGLVGQNEGQIMNSYATGAVTGVGGVGGLVGSNNGTITNSYATGSVVGSWVSVGGLVGSNGGTIMNSYATGSVRGSRGSLFLASGLVGGLAGSNGRNDRNRFNVIIANSYATGSVTGAGDEVGGLVGRNSFNAIIANSYATGSVTGGGDEVGGLVGRNSFSAIIANSYATSSVTGSGSEVGGLVGSHNGGTITNSYWDINTSGIETSDGGTSKTTVELQLSTEPGSTSNETYYNWSGNDWDFGTSIQYPILKYTDSNTLLSGQGVGLRDLEVLTSVARLSSIFGNSTTHYVISFLATRTSHISLRLRAYNTSATIKVVRQGEDNDYFENKSSEGQTEPIPIDANTALIITVIEADAETTIYMISPQVESNIMPTIMITPSLGQTLLPISKAHIVVSVADDNFNFDDIVTLEAMSSSRTIVLVAPTKVANITTDTITTFMLSAGQGGEETITFTATDIGGSRNSAELLVRVNAAPMLSGIPKQPIRLLEGLSTELDVSISDANADDSLNVRIDTSDSRIATATIIATNGATRVLEVSGVSAGNAMISVMVDDGRSVANSEISEQFEVHVETNTAPTIMITPSTSQTLPLNSTAHIVVSVADNNFDLDDIVTLAAMSSSRTIVSVTTSAETDNITNDASITFTLTAEQSGTATIKFIATDSGGLNDSETSSVRVNTAPMLRGIPEQPIRLLEGLSTEFDVAISDSDADDILDVRVNTSDSMIATATVTATNDTNRLLEVSGVGAGSAMITVTVDDGRDVANSSVSAVFEVQVAANIAPTIMIIPSTSQTLLLNSTAHIVVSVADDNFNLDDTVMLEAMSSSRTIVSVTPARVANITTDTSIVFMLSAEQDGEATITFTAIDSGGLRDSEAVSADVITAIRIRVKVFLEGSLQ